MKIKIQTDRFRFRLRFPNGLLFNRLGLFLAAHFLRGYVTIPASDRKPLLKQPKQCRKRFKGLPLVDIKTGAGEKIFITL